MMGVRVGCGLVVLTEEKVSGENDGSSQGGIV